MNTKGVTHKGIIRSVAPGSITVLTEDNCSCDGCAVVALCNKSENNEHELITVDVPSTPHLSPGDRVELVATSGSTLAATWWGLALPTLLFIATILGIRLAWEESGGWSVLAAFVVLGVYDLGLYLARRRLAGKMTWKVTKL